MTIDGVAEDPSSATYTGPGIWVEEVSHTMRIANNTIVDCAKGIRVDGVDDRSETFTMGEWGRSYRVSAVENNIVYGASSYGIRIGTGSSAKAWSPFPGDLTDSNGNPNVPVRNNLVWPRDGGSYEAFMGDSWYDDDYRTDDPGDPDPEMRSRGEVLQNPGFVDVASADYHLTVGSRALGSGSAYQIDVFPGTETSADPMVMRRSIGALPSEYEGDYRCLSSFGGKQ